MRENNEEKKNKKGYPHPSIIKEKGYFAGSSFPTWALAICTEPILVYIISIEKVAYNDGEDTERIRRYIRTLTFNGYADLKKT